MVGGVDKPFRGAPLDELREGCDVLGPDADARVEGGQLHRCGIGHIDAETGVRLDDDVGAYYDVRIAAERCEPTGYAFKNGHAAYLCRKCTLTIRKKRGRLATL